VTVGTHGQSAVMLMSSKLRLTG